MPSCSSAQFQQPRALFKIFLLVIGFHLAGGSGFKALAWDGVSEHLPRLLVGGCAADKGPFPGLPPLNLPVALQVQKQRFLEGVCALKHHRFDQARAIFEAGLEAAQDTKSLWRWYHTLALISAGRHGEAAKALTEFLKHTPPPLLVARTRYLLLTLLQADPPLSEEVKSAYLWALFLERKVGSDDYDLLEYWNNSISAGKDARLKWKLGLLLWSHPRDLDAAQAWVGYPARRRAKGLGAPPESGYLQRARRLFRLRQLSGLVQEFKPSGLPPLTPPVAKAIGRLYIRAMIRTQRYTRVIYQLNDPAFLKVFSLSQRQALVWRTRIQLRRRKTGSALKNLKKLEEISPTDTSLPDIFLDLVRYYDGRKLSVTAMHWLKRLQMEYPQAQATSDAYWHLISSRIIKKRYQQAETILDQAVKNSAGYHPVDQGRLSYWKGRLQVLRGDQEGGGETWSQLRRTWPHGYYAAMAEFNTNGSQLEFRVERTTEPKEKGPVPTFSMLWKHPPFPRALFLFSIGEIDLAAQVLKIVVVRKLPETVVEEAGELFSFLGNHYLQLLLVGRHKLKDLRRATVSDSPQWRRAFPLAYWDLIREEGASLKVDPHILLSIIREESRFFNAADSKVGARGLMQLLPSTALDIARRRRLKVDESHLHLPEVNIRLGAYYVGMMMKKFHGDFFMAVAAYNAGPRNASRWRRQFRNLPPDLFVERIPYEETQNYVKRVFLSFMTYGKLYP